MKKDSRGFAKVYLSVFFFGVLVLGLLGYLIYSNIQLKKLYTLQNEKSIETPVTPTTPVSQTTPNTKSDTKAPNENKLSTENNVIVKKIPAAPSTPSTTNTNSTKTKSAWNTFYEQLASLEDNFRADYNAVTLNFSNHSVLDFQKESNNKALNEATQIQQKVAQGEISFPSQLECLRSEKDAFDQYIGVINKSSTFINYSTYSIKVDDINTNLTNLAGSFLLRVDNKEYSKAIQVLNEIKPLLNDGKTNAVAANNIINLQGTNDYISWVDAYSLGLDEINSAFQRNDYGYVPTTDFVALGERRTKSIDDWGKQLSNWIVTNINPLVVSADKAYSLSDRLCVKDK